MGKEIVTELIQNEFNSVNLKRELDKLLNEGNRNKVQSGFELLQEKLGGQGASARTAELMLGYLR